jgi:nucleoside 2-deoxyribosyltransferase
LKTCYLAGPITGLDYAGATDWRFYAIEKLRKHGIRGLSPMRAKHYLAHLKSISGTGEEYADLGVLSTQKSVTTRDRYDTRTSDLVLMNLLGAKRVSIGTMIEAGWADAFRVPIVLVIESENVHQHMMLREIAGFTVPTLDEALDTIFAILGDYPAVRMA